MHKLSILLGLSGSEQSMYAADVAWNIANQSQGTVCAQHVIDSQTMWELLRNDRPGFIGSGPYMACYEGLLESLRSLSEKLVEKFEAVASQKGVSTTTVVEEGNPVKRVASRAVDHDLVIVGHQPRFIDKMETEHARVVRYAVAEGLANECPRPMLVVQDRVSEWTSMTILLSTDHINLSFVGACLAMAKLLGLEPKLVALSSGVREEAPKRLLADLKKADPELKKVPIEIHELSGMAVEGRVHPWASEEFDLDWTPDPDTLLVIPTRSSGGHRLTIFDTTPNLFIRNLALPSILLWPEEHTEFKIQQPPRKQKAKATR